MISAARENRSSSKVPATVFILDFGAQYSQLIARRTRESHVYCEIVPHDTPWSELAPRSPAAVILTGGPESVLVPNAPGMDPAVLSSGVPLLGICYGIQLIARDLRAPLVPLERREYGPAELKIERPESPLFHGVPARSRVWMSHGDSVLEPPSGFETLASTDRCKIAAVGDDDRRIYGVQFHPEVVQTQYGKQILDNFLHRIAEIGDQWRMESFVDRAVDEIRAQVGDAKVICALSGGVDSAVAATLVSRAVGEQLTCIFVDNGLLRKGEANSVVEAFKGVMHLNVVAVDARARFLERLAGVVDPEEKRIRIGHEFITIFEEEAAKIPDVKFLVQGTLYPDVIESKTPQSKAGHKIKSHHNVGGLPKAMSLGLVEPLRSLFKDEVRAVGRVLDLPGQIVERQPFPGPGLAVRVLGAVSEERLTILREADAIVRDEIERAILERKPWQYFAVLTPLLSVGVMGDGRTYANLVAVRAITSEDGMTADWARLPESLLERISRRIVNEVPGVNRVAYDITSKPPSTVEWE
ncbi:MAG: glutamine-hydrolyzing GMP synthase [Candidatus Eremiobacteraeota bacterium]|nr:glutamine-hydrolyzing GMP synthase [Candidatus Eremiobacteraeota bacterium]